MISCELAVKLFSGEYYRYSLMKSQHSFSAVKQQAISLADFDPDLIRYMLPLGHNELNHR